MISELFLQDWFILLNRQNPMKDLGREKRDSMDLLVCVCVCDLKNIYFSAPSLETDLCEQHLSWSPRSRASRPVVRRQPPPGKPFSSARAHTQRSSVFNTGHTRSHTFEKHRTGIFALQFCVGSVPISVLPGWDQHGQFRRLKWYFFAEKLGGDNY